jgi:hypothetical protein
VDWDSVDERLIKRGELLLGLDFLERYEDELKAVNCGNETDTQRPNELVHKALVISRK